MAQDYYTILTNAGLAYEAQQKAQNKPITLTHYGICDGNGAVYNPDPEMTALRREVTPRLPLNALQQDPGNPTWLVAEGLLPDDVGGWTIRALGIYTDTGILYAVSKCAESVKPLLASGGGKQFYVRVIFQTSNAASVTLLVDNSVVMAPRSFVIDHVRDELAKRDHKQSVRVATVEPITLSGEQSIDGLPVVAGDRVLVKDQAVAATNGIYVVAIGVWTRATDADSGAKLNPGATVPVEGGTVNADTQWMLKTDGLVTVGATGLVFQWVGGLNAPDQPLGDRSRKQANTGFVGAAVEAVAKASGRVVISKIGVTHWPVPEILRSGYKKVRVRGVGGGGGPARKGGGPLGTSVTGGSGGGGFDIVVSLEGVETVPVTVGGGGTVGAGLDSPGTPGGSTSFGTFATATGGPGGWNNGSSPGGGEAVSSAPGAILVNGQGGGISFARSDAAGVLGGPGGASMLGFGGVASVSGSGPAGYGGGAGASVVGGVFDGAQGVVIIEW